MKFFNVDTNMEINIRPILESFDDSLAAAETSLKSSSASLASEAALQALLESQQNDLLCATASLDHLQKRVEEKLSPEDSQKLESAYKKGQEILKQLGNKLKGYLS